MLEKNLLKVRPNKIKFIYLNYKKEKYLIKLGSSNFINDFVSDMCVYIYIYNKYFNFKPIIYFNK